MKAGCPVRSPPYLIVNDKHADLGAASLRARPTHQWIFPTTTARQDVPVNAPALPLGSTALHGVPGRLVYTYDALAELS